MYSTTLSRVLYFFGLSLLGLMFTAANCVGNQAPQLSPITDQELFQAETTEIPFKVTDEVLASLVVTVESSDQTLLSDGNLSVSGTGSERVLIIKTEDQKIGQVTLTVLAKDSKGLVSSTQFLVTLKAPYLNDGIKLLASYASEAGQFGFSVAISADLAMVGAPQGIDKGIAGSAYIFQRTNEGWKEFQKLSASDARTGDFFGSSVAIGTDFALVGATGNQEPGAVYIFKRTDAGWKEVAKLRPDVSVVAANSFGFSVALEGDYAIVGAQSEQIQGSPVGSAYIFKRSGETWNQDGPKLIAQDGAAQAKFGASVAIRGDTVLVGASGNTSESVYIFERQDNAWLETGKLKSKDGEKGDSFGSTVALDGKFIIVGARYNDMLGTDSGSAYIFERNADNTWKEVKLTAKDERAQDRFGGSVAIEGDYALIGAYGNSGYAGTAYMFKRKDGAWTEIKKFVASTRNSFDEFSYSLALSGGNAIIGVYGANDQGDNSGSVYIFEK